LLVCKGTTPFGIGEGLSPGCTRKDILVKKMLVVTVLGGLLVGFALSEPAFAVGCPYVIKVMNKLPNTANLLEIKSRISGLTWRVIENFDNSGLMLQDGRNWSRDYTTTSLCNTTNHDFQLKFRNTQNNIVIKTKDKIKVKNGQTITFTLGQ
jgi:hypothetical protein